MAERECEDVERVFRLAEAEARQGLAEEALKVSALLTRIVMSCGHDAEEAEDLTGILADVRRNLVKEGRRFGLRE